MMPHVEKAILEAVEACCITMIVRHGVTATDQSTRHAAIKLCLERIKTAVNDGKGDDDSQREVQQ